MTGLLGGVFCWHEPLRGRSLTGFVRWKGEGNELSTNAIGGQGISGDASEGRARLLFGPGGQGQGAALLGANAGARWRIHDPGWFKVAGKVQTGVAVQS